MGFIDMMGDYPNDADGDALRRVASMGCDMTKPMDIDFFIDVPSLEAGEQIAVMASRSGYQIHLEYDDEDDHCSCCCTKRMVPSYEAVLDAQLELDGFSRPFGGRSDGWGTLGHSD